MRFPPVGAAFVISFCAVSSLLGFDALAASPTARARAPKLKKPVISAPASSSSGSSAADAYFGKKITALGIEGNHRIEKEALLGKLTSKVGQVAKREDVRADIQGIFALGHFDEIDVQAEGADGGVRLIYVVKERPVVSRIEFEGNEKIEDSDLKEVIKVKEWSILDVNKVKEDVRLLQKHYEDKGFYLAKVSYEIRPKTGKDSGDKGDEVELIYRVNDYDKVTVKKITFLNNKRFTDDQLKGVMRETKEGSALSFLSGSGSFKDASFKQDLTFLAYWYLDHGYVKFRPETPVVTVSEDKRWLFISVYLEEGEQYRIGNVDFSGDLLFSKEELAADLQMKTGEVFSITQRNLDIQKLTEKYQDLGYAYVNVVPKMKFNDETKTIDFEYSFEKGNLVYFGEISVSGNTKTYDKVIRRELKFREGELFSGSALRVARENVERLGFFQPGEVLFNTTTPKGKEDLMNVEIVIKERSTGTITVGAGYGGGTGFFFTGQVSEINFLGRGQTLSAQAQFAAGNDQKLINLGVMDPYFFDTRWSGGGDMFWNIFGIPNRYTARKLGGDLRFGYPISDYIQAFVTYKLEHLTLVNQIDMSADVGRDQGLLSSVVWSVVRDKRNNRFETTSGNYQSVSFETAGLGGDKKFLKWILNNRFYARIVGDLVFRNSIEYGQIMGLAGQDPPPSERFYLGGPNNMKGYGWWWLGPLRDSTKSDGSPIIVPEGAQVELFSLFELEYPLIREAGLKAVAFFDMGNGFRRFPGTGGEPWDIKYDAGFGIRWFSPIGPLRFEWAFPLNRRPGNLDLDMQFIFFIGPPF